MDMGWLRITVAWLAAIGLIASAPARVSAELREWDGDGVLEEGEDETAELARAASVHRATASRCGRSTLQS